MKKEYFYKKINENIENLDREELICFINKIISKIDVQDYNEIIDIFENSKCINNDDKINNKIKEYKTFFDKLNNIELYFYMESCEDYESHYWSDNWVYEYYDKDNIGNYIKSVYNFAEILIDSTKYSFAKEILDLIIFTNYNIYDEYSEDFNEVYLSDLKSNQLINFDVKKLYLDAIYVTFMCSNKKDKAKNIYQYYNLYEFKNIKISDSFKLYNIKENLYNFYKDWICILLNNKGNTEYNLLKEALECTKYNNYEKYIDKIIINYPNLCLDIFKYLEKENRIDEIICLGKLFLKELNDDLIIKSDIAIYLSKFDNNLKEKCYIIAFKSNTNVINLLRVINNNYYFKNKKIIDDLIKINTNDGFQKSNYVSEYDYNNLMFFIGNFDYVFSVCEKEKKTIGWSSSYLQYGVFLFLTLLDDNINSKVYKDILISIANELGYDNRVDFIEDFNNWKKQFNINDKEKILEWLKIIIDKRVCTIVEKQYRNSYFEVARLVIALDEIAANGKFKYVNYYLKKYPNHVAFKKEIKKYLG